MRPRVSKHASVSVFPWSDFMATEIKVILFEDVQQTKSQLVAALRKHLKSAGSVLPFDSESVKESEADRNRMFQDRLKPILGEPPYEGSTLFVADRDLSMSPRFIGMSVGA